MSDLELELEAQKQDDGFYTITIQGASWDEVKLISQILTMGAADEDVEMTYTTEDGQTHTA